MLDRQASAALARQLFPDAPLTPLDDGNLAWTNPTDDEIVVGCFQGVTIVAAMEFALDYPSTLPQRFRDSARGNTVHLHAMHSVVDWFAFAVWQNGQLQRSLSVSPDSGVMEDLGARLPFEVPFWAGQHPAIDPDDAEDEENTYPVPFHPLELGEAALGALFGYQLEGLIDATLFEPQDVPLLRFSRAKSPPRIAAPAQQPSGTIVTAACAAMVFKARLILAHPVQ